MQSPGRCRRASSASFSQSRQGSLITRADVRTTDRKTRVAHRPRTLTAPVATALEFRPARNEESTLQRSRGRTYSASEAGNARAPSAFNSASEAALQLWAQQ